MATPLSLPPELTICHVAETRLEWLKWPELKDHSEATRYTSEGAGAARTLTVDASTVHEVDAAGLQLLLSLQNTLQAQGWGLALGQPSATLCRASEILGLTGLLGLAKPEGAAP
jgi:ABC-type transporter Mla MlaB component